MLSFTLASLALSFFTAATTATPHGGDYALHKRIAHRATSNELAARDASNHVELVKRFDNARFTFYAAGLGACGKTNTPSDFIVALNSAQYAGGSHCGQQITITAKGKTTQATIMDECPGCPFGGLDFTEGLFKFFASEDEGVIQGTWNFGGGGGGGNNDDPKPTTTSKTQAPPPPTTTKETTTSKETPTTTSKQEPTTTSTSSSSSSSSSIPSSSQAASSAASTPTDTVRQFEEAFLMIGQMVLAGQASH